MIDNNKISQKAFTGNKITENKMKLSGNMIRR